MGFGGGTILIPALVIFSEINQQQAQGVNLIVFLPIASIAIYIHNKDKNINFKVSKWIIACGIFGAIIGSLFAVKINPDTLRFIFGVFLLIVGIFGLVKK